MGNKILVELDKARIKEWCKLQRIYPSCTCPCSACKLSDKELIQCVLMEGSLHIDTDYKIKDQNNEIKPKFKVGDKLYVVDCWVERDEFGCIVNEECFVKTKPLIVDKILIDRYFIFYGERDTQIGEFIEESHCFATQAEAQAECDRRNNG